MASAYDNRYHLVDKLIMLDSERLQKLLPNLPAISELVQGLDFVISGKQLPTTDLLAFKNFLEATNAIDAKRGIIPMEWRDWHEVEFSRLSRMMANSASHPVIEHVYYDRQVGVTTFIMVYAAYMASVGKTVTIVSRTKQNCDHIKGHAERSGVDISGVKLVSSMQDIVLDDLGDQVIFDSCSGQPLMESYKLTKLGQKFVRTVDCDYRGTTVDHEQPPIMVYDTTG